MPSKSSEPKADIYTFGRDLLETLDLDPVYVVLEAAEFPQEKLERFLVAYWLFYSLGTSSWIVDQRDFWEACLVAARDATHPRGTERRHFRGQKAVDAVSGIKNGARTCAELVTGLGSRGETPTLSTVSERVKRLPQFGPWIAFKVADMLERLDLCPVVFSPTDIFKMFDSPRKGAEAMAEWYGYTGNPYIWAYNRLKVELGSYTAPPRFERTINIQEIETILCKWKSYLGGHYEVGKDTRECHHALERYRKTPTARELLAAGMRRKLWPN